MIRLNVDLCKNEPRFMPFSFDLYYNADDKNKFKTISISHAKN